MDETNTKTKKISTSLLFALLVAFIAGALVTGIYFYYHG